MKLFLASFLFLPFAVIAADTNDLPKLIPAYGEIQPTFVEQHGMLIIIGCIALVVLAVLVVWKRLQPNPAVVVPPEIVALNALTKLGSQPEDRKLLGEVSQILRRYISAAFEMPAAELTTAEFCAALAENKKIGDKLAKVAGALLHDCDEQKFSSSPVTAPLTAVARALELVMLAENRRAQISQTP